MTQVWIERSEPPSVEDFHDLSGGLQASTQFHSCVGVSELKRNVMWRTLFNAKRLLSSTVFVISLILVATDSSSAQNQTWREIQKHPVTKFDWNCASPSTYPQSKLARLVKAALKHERPTDEVPDRAFPFDLNQDGRSEYFVPLVCGAVGNCDWGVFALSPTRFLGKVNGQYIFVHRRRLRWPAILTYGHLSAMEGALETYVYTRGRYRMSGQGLPIGAPDRTLDIQNVPGHRMPRFLDKARGACKDLGS